MKKRKDGGEGSEIPTTESQPASDLPAENGNMPYFDDEDEETKAMM